MITRAGIIYLASFAAHGALAVGIVSLKGLKKFEDVSISMVETKQKKREKEEPRADDPPPPPRPLESKAPSAPNKAKTAPALEANARAVEAAPTPVTEAAPDFGLSLGGGTSGPGLGVRAAAAPAASASPAPVHKVLAAAPVASARCDEPPKKPRAVSISQPAYTAEARTANIAGKVRVEITVDESGHVTRVRVLEGLGYGLDEAATASARAATFEPGTLCGKPTTATFTVAMRFTL